MHLSKLHQYSTSVVCIHDFYCQITRTCLLCLVVVSCTLLTSEHTQVHNALAIWMVNTSKVLWAHILHTYAEITLPNIPVAGQHVKQTMFGLQDYTVSGTIYCGSYYYGTTYQIVSTFQALSGAKLSTCTCSKSAWWRQNNDVIMRSWCSHPAITGRNSTKKDGPVPLIAWLYIKVVILAS